MNEAADYPSRSARSTRAGATPCCDGLHRIGWDMPRPKGTMFVWAPIPEPYREMGSVEFASMLVREAQVALSPGVGFGPGGEGYVRFALIENEQRIAAGDAQPQAHADQAGLSRPGVSGRRCGGARRAAPEAPAARRR